VNELTAYRDSRLELGDMIRAALHLARGSGDEEAEKRARELLARLAADRFQLAVVGQFSRGKTTLMNALLGGAYLPMGALPVTSVITTVRYGSQPRAMVRRRPSSLRVEVALADVAEFISGSSAERAGLRVATVEVEVPAEILRLGFELVDTPGVGSAIEINTATTWQFLPQADAVIFVTGFDSPLTGTEVRFLADAARHAGKLFLVLNKRDLVSGPDAVAVTEFVRCRLREDLGLGEPRLFGLSALEALEATVQGDSERLSGSGLTALRAALTGFLATGKTRLFLHNVAERGAALVAGQRRNLQLGRLALDGGPHPSQVLTGFAVRMAELDQERRSTADKITGRIASGLPDLLTARSPAWQASLKELLDPCVEQAIPADAAASAQDRLKTGQKRLEEAGRGIARGWLERRTGEVLELLTGMVAGQISVLLEGARSPGMAGAEIAGVAGGDDHRGPGGWTADDVPGLAVRPPEWTVQVPLPRRFGRKLDGSDTELRHRLADALNAAISAFEASARARFEDAAQDWARRLDEQAAGQAQEAAAYFRRCLRTMPKDEDLAALNDLAARLAGLQASLAAGDRSCDEDAAAEPGPAASTRAGAGRAGGCAVCEQLQATLSEHLCHDQFRLATLEHDQERHALAGGYCPLHTWQYAAIASPLGISAGYAKLAASMADALESIGRKGSTAADLASLVAALDPRPGTCPLCALLAERERSVITGLTSGTPAEAGSAALCLRHLTLALAADPGPETGRAMVRALADALRRNADDMRAYALKREALHCGLTEEESGAYLDALRRLAGLPALSRP
jgi:Dynamin family